MSDVKKGLTPGSSARIYRDGGDLVGQVNVPDDGPLVLRDLPPGQYEARDETGGRESFVVSAFEETVTVDGDHEEAVLGQDERVPAAAGSSELTEPIEPVVPEETPVEETVTAEALGRTPERIL